jgi:GNAT superfamily N-acetyltransferase
MNKGVSIRVSTLEDYEGISEVYAEADTLHAAALPMLFKRTDKPARTRELISSIISDENNALFVADFDNRVVGLVHAVIRETPQIPIMVPLRYAWVSDIAVIRKFHRLGIGRLLMDEVKRWALDKAASQIQLNVWDFNKEAMRFYESLGYTTGSHMMWKTIE